MENAKSPETVKQTPEEIKQEEIRTALETKLNVSVHIISATVKGQTAVGYLKKPDRPIISMFTAKMGEDPMAANEILMRACLCEGSDMRLVEDTDFFLTASTQLGGLIEIGTATLKKSLRA